MRAARRLLPALAAGLLLALLPLGGGALGATSFGANGDIAFARGSDVYRVSTGTALVTGAIDPSWSPDGTKLAFTTSSGHAIETCTVSSCSPAQVGTITGTQPAWSPDATKLAYVSGGQIHVVKTDGTGDSGALAAGADPSWSADGTQLVFTQSGAIVTMSSSGGGVTSVTTTGVSGTSQPAWSPDGSRIAFQSASSGHSHIYVVDAGGGTPTQVTPASSDEETAPSWSPDGDSIVYADGAHGIQSVTQGSGGSWAAPTTRDANTSDATPDWQTVAPIAVSAPSITGGAAPQTGQQLSATNGSWNGASATGFTYRWQQCDTSGNGCSDISGATASTYAVVSADVGHTLRVVVTASNPAGSTSSTPSSASGVVALAGSVVPPRNTAYPVISLPFGQTSSAPLIGTTLTASTGTWTGSFPITYAYQWKKCVSPTGSCFEIAGATSVSFAVPTSVYGWSLRVQVTASNSAASVPQNSEATPLVTAIAPANRATPPITGQNVVDQTLSVTTGTWDGSTPITFTYSWRRCNPQGDLGSCISIPGATAATYVPTVQDIGLALRVWITGTNPAGSDVVITNHTFPIVDKPHFAPSVKSAPIVQSTPSWGLPAAASAGSFAGDLPIDTGVQWQRCDATGAACHVIPGATKPTYTPGNDDVGFTLRFVVTATNAYGTLTASSDPTEPIAAPLPHFRGRRIVGTRLNDYLLGTHGDDVVYGLAGNDTIIGNGGYDWIDGGPGNDVITVNGPGSSRVYGGPGSDTIYAANGFKDFIDCGLGNDRAVVDAFDVVKSCEVVQTVKTPSVR